MSFFKFIYAFPLIISAVAHFNWFTADPQIKNPSKKLYLV